MNDEERDHIIDDEEPIPVLEGEDDIPHQPAPPLDPYTPEPGPGPGEERAFGVMRIAVFLLLGALIVGVIAFLVWNA